jgi:hypothetical protein
MVQKSNTNFLSTAPQKEFYSLMLRRRAYQVRDAPDRCVGNVTHLRRSEPNKWTAAGGDQQKTCDTCIRQKRFCARLVETGGVVKLGFYPLPGHIGEKVEWRDIRYWADGKKP